MSLDALVEVSRRYGSDPQWVLAGGGNTSFKDDENLYVKASGYPLSTIGPNGFARMNRRALQRIWSATYPEKTAEREAAALTELMAAREQGETRRPSVETLMHELFPYPLVVHTHPAFVNGLTCAVDGERAARRLFGTRLLWIPAVEPGYVLAMEMRRAAQDHLHKYGVFPRLVMLQNHGLVIAGRGVSDIDLLHREVRRVVHKALTREPDLTPAEFDPGARDRWDAAIRIAFPHDVTLEFHANAELHQRLHSPKEFAPLAGAFTPDHIVYAGSAPLYVTGDSIAPAAGLSSLIAAYRHDHGADPRIIAIERLGVVAVAETASACRTALALFLDEVKIAAYADSFGGARHLDPHLVKFIESWEVERYRKKISEGGSPS